jgi:hypothetical protein
MKEGVTTTMKRRKGVGAGRTPHGWLSLSPIYIGYIFVLQRHLVVSIPYLVAPHHGCCLSKALPKLLATNTWKKWRRRRSSSGSLLLLPRWTEGMEDVTEPYM